MDSSKGDLWSHFRVQTDLAAFHQEALETATTELQKLTTVTNTDNLQASLANILFTLKPAVDGLGAWFHEFMNAENTSQQSWITSSSSTAYIDRVFQVPEILESILLLVEIPDLLAAMQVNKHLFATISASKALQRKLHLLPAKQGSHFQVLQIARKHLKDEQQYHFYRPTFHIGLSQSWHQNLYWLYPNDRMPDEEILEKLDKTAQIVIVSQPRSDGALRVGLRRQQMFLTQPPIATISYTVQCCRPPSTAPEHSFVLTNQEGLRVGDVLAILAKMQQDHRLCPNAGVSVMNKDGFAEPTIEFKADVTINKDHPMLLKTLEGWKIDVARSKRYDSRSLRMDFYAEKKKSAHRLGEPIPTLAEFLETFDEAAASLLTLYQQREKRERIHRGVQAMFSSHRPGSSSDVAPNVDNAVEAEDTGNSSGNM